jgi:cytochrome c-type biogenesis protein CcmF
MTGSVVIWIAFAAALASTCFFYLSLTKRNMVQVARSSFYISVIGIATASVLLLLYILQHRFEYNYVSSYSSRDLSTALLMTTFWAGQEGSFLLWALFAAVIGLILQFYTQRKNIEGEAMSVYSLVLTFLLLLIAIKTPFQYVWDVVANNVPKGFIPQDGRGLNPLLQSVWMIIHPPVLFVGFASLAVPFVLAVAALWQKKYNDWIHAALPWVLFSGVSLGAGLMLGGYWAYGVLGWGGWWGWDPVENSSLIPWMVAIILIHTMLVQMLTGRLVRTNFILAVTAYLLVIYSTFLTRSGILANASVHSFVDPGALVYTLLVIWLAVIVIGGFGMILMRRKELNSQKSSSAWLTRESLLSIATIVIGVCAAVILFGTSKPLFSNATVEPSFYDRTNLPLAALMTLLLGISLRAKWNIEDRQLFLKRLLIPGVLSLAVLAFLIIRGLHDLLAASLVLTSLFALFVSIDHGYRVAKEQPLFIGGALSHMGLALLFLGIIASGRYGQKQSVSLPLNQPKEVFGDTLMYVGASPSADGKSNYEVKLIQNGQSAILRPVMFESSYNNSLMRNPDYISYLTKDFYIEPVSLEQGNASEDQNILSLPKGEPVLYGPIQITFKQFDLGSHNKDDMMGSKGEMSIGVVLEVETEKGIQTLVPATTFSAKGTQMRKTVYLKNSAVGFQLIGMNVATTKGAKSIVQVNVVGLGGMSHGGAQKSDMFIAEVSVKPFMNLVWTASVLIVEGLAIAMIRRLKQSSV